MANVVRRLGSVIAVMIVAHTRATTWLIRSLGSILGLGHIRRLGNVRCQMEPIHRLVLTRDATSISITRHPRATRLIRSLGNILGLGHIGSDVGRLCDYFATAGSTAVNLSWALSRMRDITRDNEDDDTAALVEALTRFPSSTGVRTRSESGLAAHVTRGRPNLGPGVRHHTGRAHHRDRHRIRGHRGAVHRGARGRGRCGGRGFGRRA